MSSDQQAAQHAEQCAQQRDAMSALMHARHLGLSDEECMALAYSAGIANDFYKEIQQ